MSLGDSQGQPNPWRNCDANKFGTVRLPLRRRGPDRSGRSMVSAAAERRLRRLPQDAPKASAGIASMLEYVRLLVAQQVESRTGRQEVEAGLRQLKPAFADQQRLQPRPERMQVQHIRSGVGELVAGKLRVAPVGGLLLLRQI